MRATLLLRYSRWAAIGSLMIGLVACSPTPPPPPPPPPKTLDAAVRDRDVQRLDELLEAGLPMDDADAEGDTLLHLLVTIGDPTLVTWALAAGADPNRTNNAGWAAWELADAAGEAQLVELMALFGANVPEPEPVVVVVEAEPEVEEVEPEPEPELPPGWDQLEFRTWTSAQGDTVEAAFIEIRQDLVVLGSREGLESRVPIEEFVHQDQILIRQRAAQQAGGEEDEVDRRTSSRSGSPRVEAEFSRQCEQLLVRAIERARDEVLVAVYSFTRSSIQRALSSAARRGVDVHVKYDTGQLESGTMAGVIAALEKNGVKMSPIRMSGNFASMHHKFVVIDGEKVFTGSFNFTNMAVTENYENCVLIESSSVAREFEREFDRIYSR
jgi:hypothetical protein